MKLENLTFITKRGVGGSRGGFNFPAVRISSVKAGTGNRVRIGFLCCDTLYSSNNYCRPAIASDRLYFYFCGETEQAYKLLATSKGKKSKSQQMFIRYNKEISKFIRSQPYTPKLDSECGLWYIEY